MWWASPLIVSLNRIYRIRPGGVSAIYSISCLWRALIHSPTGGSQVEYSDWHSRQI